MGCLESREELKDQQTDPIQDGNSSEKSSPIWIVKTTFPSNDTSESPLFTNKGTDILSENAHPPISSSLISNEINEIPIIPSLLLKEQKMMEPHTIVISESVSTSSSLPVMRETQPLVMIPSSSLTLPIGSQLTPSSSSSLPLPSGSELHPGESFYPSKSSSTTDQTIRTSSNITKKSQRRNRKDVADNQLNLHLQQQKKQDDTSPRSGPLSGRRSSNNNPQWVPKGSTPRVAGNPGGATGETDQIAISNSESGDKDENAIAAATGEANNDPKMAKIPVAANPIPDEKPGDEADTEGTGKKKQNKNKQKQDGGKEKGSGKQGGKKGNQKKQNAQ